MAADMRPIPQQLLTHEAVVTHATIGIIVCDRAGAIVLANDKAADLFDYSAEQLRALTIEALVPDSVRPHHQQLRETFNAQPTVRAMSGHRGLVARRRDGSVFPVEISLSYFYLASELYVVSYILDMTVQRATEQELQDERDRVERLNADLERQVAERTQALQNTLAVLEHRSAELTSALAVEQELGELKSRFVSMASHEFRTPLTAVLTSAALIEKYTDSGQQDKRLRHLDRIRASVKHLTDILEEFLSVGRIEEGRVEARPAALDLAALVQEALGDVQGMRKAGQRVATALNVSGSMWLDTSLLRKVLVNLLSNALKYSPEDATVALEAHAAAGTLTLVVRDQGLGISAEDQEHLFERFFRARNVTNIPGTGLGLYIIARYLELMGGTIALRSALHTGTTVTITVPYADHPAD